MAELSFKERSAESLLVEGIDDARISMAGRHLIAQHRRGRVVDITAFDVPHAALASLSGQLEALGVTHDLSEPLLDALRRYIIARGGEFSRTASAKPVRIHMAVSDGLPGRRFENGLTEVACIGAEALKVQGVSGQNVRTTISGTATTSNAADVDAMFANVRGLRLWLRFEAPTKEDLDGLMTAMESALAGVAQAVGGSMAADDFKNLLDTLDSENALTPQMEELIESLIALQKAGELGLSDADIGALVRNISTLISEGQANGLIPAPFIDAATKALGELASNDVLRGFLMENGFEDLAASNDNALSIEDRLAELMERIDSLQSMDGLEPALSQELQELVESLQEQIAQDNADLSAILESMSEKLMAVAAREDIPQAVFDGIGDMLPDIAALKQEMIEAGIYAPDLSNAEAMLAAIEDIAAKIEAGELDMADVPPDVIEMMEQLGGMETLTQEQGREARLDAVVAAMGAPESSPLGAAITAAVTALSDPALRENFPTAMQQAAQIMVDAAPALSVQAFMAPPADPAFTVLETERNIPDMSAMVPMTAATPAGGGLPAPDAGGNGETAYRAPVADPVASPSASNEPADEPRESKGKAKPEKQDIEDDKDDPKQDVPSAKPKGKVERPVKENRADSEKGDPEKEPDKPHVPERDHDNPERETGNPGPVSTECKKTGKDDCVCGAFNDAGSGDTPPSKPEISPEVQEITSKLDKETTEKYGGSEKVQETLQRIRDNDPEAFKTKTVEEILHQDRKKPEVTNLLDRDEKGQPKEPERPLDNPDRDERKRLEMIAKRDGVSTPPTNNPSSPDWRKDGLTPVHQHVCNSGCDHGGQEGKHGKEQAATFEGENTGRRRGRNRSQAPANTMS